MNLDRNELMCSVLCVALLIGVSCLWSGLCQISGQFGGQIEGAMPQVHVVACGFTKAATRAGPSIHSFLQAVPRTDVSTKPPIINPLPSAQTPLQPAQLLFKPRKRCRQQGGTEALQGGGEALQGGAENTRKQPHQPACDSSRPEDVGQLYNTDALQDGVDARQRDIATRDSTASHDQASWQHCAAASFLSPERLPLETGPAASAIHTDEGPGAAAVAAASPAAATIPAPPPVAAASLAAPPVAAAISAASPVAAATSAAHPIAAATLAISPVAVTTSTALPVAAAITAAPPDVAISAASCQPKSSYDVAEANFVHKALGPASFVSEQCFISEPPLQCMDPVQCVNEAAATSTCCQHAELDSGGQETVMMASNDVDLSKVDINEQHRILRSVTALQHGSRHVAAVQHDSRHVTAVQHGSGPATAVQRGSRPHSGRGPGSRRTVGNVGRQGVPGGRQQGIAEAFRRRT